MALTGAVIFVLALAVPGLAAPGDDPIADARQALDSGDAIAAEVNLRKALAQGAKREAVAALMGEAMLAQNDPDKARDWLGPGQFTPDTAPLGFRALARLERMGGNLAAAGKAFDQVMALTPRDPSLWVEIGRLRYAGGEHMLAIDAADYALKLDPENVRALRFKGELIRDSQGLAAALPWFEHGLRNQPRDIDVLGEYAATLGDLGRARDMLAVTRQMLDVAPGNPYAYFLQATMAARAGNIELARGLLARTRDKFDDTPAGLLLEGVLELQAGNHFLAADALSELVRRQPANRRVGLLLARAYALAGENGLVIHDNADEAALPEASPYLLALVGRAYEASGRRDLAAPLLDRAALARRPETYPVVPGSDLGGLLAGGRLADAQAAADRNLAANPGSSFNQAVAGDVRLAAGDAAGALARYRLAAYVRLPRSLLLRMTVAARHAGQPGEADALAARYLTTNPEDAVAARLVAARSAQAGDWPRARALLEPFADGSDVDLLADLARAQLRTGDATAAEATARRAYGLQRGSAAASQAWGLALEAQGQHARASWLLVKSRGMLAAR